MKNKITGRKVYTGIENISGPIIVVRNIKGVAFGEKVTVLCPDGSKKSGQVLTINEEYAVIQVFEGTFGLNKEKTRVIFEQKPIELGVSEKMLGRVLNAMGEPLDGGPPPIPEKFENIYGYPINPLSREYPRDFIQTGISVIDIMNTVVRGQKLPVFSGAGLPHNLLTAQIIRQAKLKEKSDKFVIIFAAMGIKSDEAAFFQRSFSETGVLNNVVSFLNLANDPPIERLLIPHSALTLAEYLAFEKDMHVLVVLSDMTNYCEALREVSGAREEIPSRKGYPGYLYSNLASIYERTGRIQGTKGSITQIPILSMPNDDITHPIPDLTGYITEGEIVLNRDLFRLGIYPPISVLPSLSRLMKDGIGEGKTRADHPHLASQLYGSYSYVNTTRALASVIGIEELSELDKDYMRFGEAFERNFVNQDFYENRTIEESLSLAWKILRNLKDSELTRLTKEEIEKFGLID
ncbi:V-type ATP synthase subunit B [Candidatus Dependentiae bacterium]|nr:V-type ATP synthase subunit B [Candidatus Dependentiae bacterium]